MSLSFKNYLNEKLSINKNYETPFKEVPNDKKELANIIRKRLDDQGPGTKKNPIDFNDIDIKNVEDLNGLFRDVEFRPNRVVKFIDISCWSVEHIKDFSKMFEDCIFLQYIGDISKWYLANAENLSFMFKNCKRLSNIGDLSDWNVKRVSNFAGMFQNCERLEPVNIDDWAPDINSNVTPDNVKMIISGTSGWKMPAWVKKIKSK